MGTKQLHIEPLVGGGRHLGFGAVIREIDLRSLDEPTWLALHDAWIEHALLVFPDQHLTRDEQNEFALRFGDLEFPAAPITNIDRDGVVHSEMTDDIIKSIRGNEGWHHDSTYMPVQAKGAVFSAEIIPSWGATTGFLDMRRAYDDLDDDTKVRLEAMSAHHSLEYSQGRVGYLPTERKPDGSYGQYGYHGGPAPLRPLVKVHPVTGRKNLLVGRHAHAIPGMTFEESEQFLDALHERACDDANAYYHEWSVGDTILWDNRRLMHRATPFDFTEPRRMWHTRIAGDPVTETARNY